MESVPVAQMSNGLPYVEPQASERSAAAGEMGVQAISPQAANTMTTWITATVTSVEIQTSILTSVITSISITTQISTVIINAADTSHTPGITNSGPATISSLSNTEIISQTESLATTTNSLGMTMSTPMTALTSSLFTGNASSMASEFMSLSPTATNMLPPTSESDSTALINHASNHNSLIKTMGVLVSSIFLVSAILAIGVYFFRKRAEKVSEVEAAKTVQRQEQPLMNESIVPYSSAYGTS